MQPGARSGSGTDTEPEGEEDFLTKYGPFIGLAVGVAVLLGGGFLFKGKIRSFVDYFIRVVGDLGPLG